jgi:hypothetical protein
VGEEYWGLGTRGRGVLGFRDAWVMSTGFRDAWARSTGFRDAWARSTGV